MHGKSCGGGIGYTLITASLFSAVSSLKSREDQAQIKVGQMKQLSDRLLRACLDSSFILRAEIACQRQRNFIMVSVGGNHTLSLLLPDNSVLSQVGICI